MWLLLIMGIAGCPKKDLVKEARSAFTNQNCARTLETYVRSAGCESVTTINRPMEVLFRCEKPDSKRGKVWDNYWFRISPSNLIIYTEQLPEVERHTICIDEQHRIEAYPPN